MILWNGKQKKNGKAGGVNLQSRMSRKVLIPVICLVIIAIISAVIGHRNLKSMYQASNEITSVYMTKTAQLNEISDKFKEMEILAYSMCVTKSTNDRASMLEQSAATKEEINGLLEQLDQMAVTEDEKSRVQNITAYYQGFTDAYQKVTDSIENGNKTQAQEYCNLELFKAANKLSDEHMASAIRFVSSHEVGHTFGLKHNMGASHAFPVDSLRSPSFTAKMGGTASSIMDYARFNYVAQPGDGVKEITPKIGTYDKFAINWAYRWLDTETPQEELPILNEWIQEHEGDPMYWYGEQQDPKDPIDPRSQDEDLGDDIVKANRYGIMNLKRIVPNIVAWTEEDGESFAEAGKLLMAVINQWKMYAGHVTANVGGIYINNPVKGSPEDRYIPVPKEIQKESVKYLIEEVFIVPEWLFGAEVWKKSYPIQMGVEYSPYTVARELQYATFYNLLKDERLLRMFDSEATLGRTKSYTPEEMFADIHNVIFASSKAGHNLSIYERMTQKNFVDAIIVSSNRAVEKTTKKALHHSNTCCFASKVPEFTIEPREEVQLRILHFSSMGRVSEAVSVKRGELLKILKLAENKRNTGNVETRNHYEDLIIRIKEALNMR